MMMFGEKSAIRFQDERITVVAVGLGEGAVDGDGFAAPLQRRLAFLDFRRDMAVDDQAALRVGAELGQHFLAKGDIVNEVKVWVFLFDVANLVVDKVIFKRRDAVFSKERRPGAAPEVPEQIKVLLDGMIDASDHDALDGVEQVAAVIFLAIDFEGKEDT